MFELFRKKEKKQEQPAAEEVQYPAAPGTEIRYSPDLIGELTGEHRQLLELYGDIRAVFEQEKFEAVSELLDHFRGILQGHLLTENIRLYIYLERNFSRDEINAELIREFRREMDGIGKTVMNFLRKYEAIGVDRDLAAAFGRDFDELGKVLTRRIEREESTLYPLYMPIY